MLCDRQRGVKARERILNYKSTYALPLAFPTTYDMEPIKSQKPEGLNKYSCKIVSKLPLQKTVTQVSAQGIAINTKAPQSYGPGVPAKIIRILIKYWRHKTSTQQSTKYCNPTHNDGQDTKFGQKQTCLITVGACPKIGPTYNRLYEMSLDPCKEGPRRP